MQFDRNIYAYNWRKLTAWLIPVRLRQPRLMATAEAATSAITAIYALFRNYKLDVEYQLTITPQVCYLEKMLNDRFDFAQRRITVTDGAFYPPLLLYRKIEAKRRVLYTKSEGQRLVLYRKSETEAFNSDFTINIPARLQYDENELRALVDKYKLAGKVYLINNG